jgi:hypothetical protein
MVKKSLSQVNTLEAMDLAFLNTDSHIIKSKFHIEVLRALAW